MGEAITFWVLAVVSVAAAFGLVFSRKAVYSALMLGVVMLSLAVLYAVQEAPFLAAVQIIVYTGAVMMLFLFVLMLVGVDSSDSLVETIRGQRFWAFVAGLGFAVLLALGIGNVVIGAPAGLSGAVSQVGGNVPGLAHLIFTRYVFVFEVTSALLITAALGAMVLAHRERREPKPTQKDLSRARFLGDHPAPLPGPGTYARHNAIDMPALLPDGTVSELSVNRVIARHDVEDGHLPNDPRLAQAIRNVAEAGVRTEQPKVVQAVAEAPEVPVAERDKPAAARVPGDGPVEEEGK
ncbi:NADH:ubiquinone oxidoreductase subunit J [Sphaerisporangium melleum]|uniref:NADH-quinone oxidoreductase subunit J n=1 Tax=Sphaerisporangium melleum TaxID=321316 RepID=A0A917VMP4_9ACTN|nr:NADH-quinone oxidoreductase subunit J [Sphaerisporangium melleum]GGK99591.1 NADH:ubiquinone oxidoreductase subunit J [Sphaerisporangium melleum]GII73613.1 NADH:ubiquinone oxidoreductase subunit J [Sphaerisporangium melleum]